MKPGPGDSKGVGFYAAARWVICAAVLFHAVGLTIAIFTRTGTAWGGIALMEWGTPHDTIAFWERVGAVLLLAGAVSLLLRPTLLIALLMSAAICSEAYARYHFGGDHFVEWAIPSAALRWMMPLALLPLLGLLGPLPPHRVRAVIAMWILRIGLAIVFAVHGYQAIGKHPGFIDLLIGSSQTLLGYRLTESNAVTLLFIIGIVDFIVAAAILVGRWRALLAWLCLWSTVTALSRVTSLGVMSYPEVLLRASHILAPVAVWCLGAYLDAKPQVVEDAKEPHRPESDDDPPPKPPEKPPEKVIPVMGGDAARVG